MVIAASGTAASDGSRTRPWIYAVRWAHAGGLQTRYASKTATRGPAFICTAYGQSYDRRQGGCRMRFVNLDGKVPLGLAGGSGCPPWGRRFRLSTWRSQRRLFVDKPLPAGEQALALFGAAG